MFKVEIIGIEDFFRLVKFIRSANFDEEKLNEMARDLNKDADKLIEAEKQQGE